MPSIEDQYANLSPFYRSQQRTFVMWANQKLLEGGEDPVPVGPAAAAAFKDGTVVARLLQCFTQKRISGIQWNPKNPLHVASNWSVLYKVMEGEGISLGGITSLGLSQGRQQTVMALLWRYICQYDLAVVIPGLSDGIDGLMQWVQPRVHKHRPELDDFTRDWVDGVAFLALYESVSPEDIDMSSVNPAEHRQNLQRAFDLFEQKLGVPQLLKPEDVTGKYDSKKANVVYIVQIRNAILKYEQDKKKQEELDREAAKNAQGKRIAENSEHQNAGDDLYKKGRTLMNAANTDAEEKVDEIVTVFAVDKFRNMLDSEENRCPTDAEYDVVVGECLQQLEDSMTGFDSAKEKFDGAKNEYRMIKPPHDPNPDEKIENCDAKIGECDGLKEKYRDILKERLKSAVENDKGEKKYEEGCVKELDSIHEGGEFITALLEEVKKEFDKTKSDAEREPIARDAERKVIEAADRLFDPVSTIFIEAEQLMDSSDRKSDCRKKVDEMEAHKAQMLEEIRIKVAEEKALRTQAMELKPEELLELYHEKTILIQDLIEGYTGTASKIGHGGDVKDMSPDDINTRLEEILAQVAEVFGSKDNLRAKVHASVDLVFDRNHLP